MGVDRYLEERSSGRDNRAHERITELEAKVDSLHDHVDRLYDVLITARRRIDVLEGRLGYGPLGP